MKSYKRSVLIVSLFIMFAISFNACFLDPDYRARKDLIAFVATDTSGAETIILANYNNPEDYKQITPPEIEAFEPKFSHDKSKILLRGNNLDYPDYPNYCYFIYNLETDSLTKIEEVYINPLTSNDYFLNEEHFWDIDDKGFYYTIIYEGGKYYNLETRSITTMSYRMISQMSSGDLIFLGGIDLIEDNINSYYFVLSGSGEITHITNPYFETIRSGTDTYQYVYNVFWDNDKDKFIYTYRDTTVNGFRISVSDFKGSYRNEYTYGYYDQYPAFGPKNIIFFDRKNVSGDRNIQAYMVNMKDSQTQSLIDYMAIDGIVNIRNVTY